MRPHQVAVGDDRRFYGRGDTGNRRLSEEEIFEDTTVATAILDRLLHCATVVHIDGESYRMRAHHETLKGPREGVAGGAEIP